MIIDGIHSSTRKNPDPLTNRIIRSPQDIRPRSAVGPAAGMVPKAAVSSGILESLIAHHDGKLDERILKMVRMKVSVTAAQVNYWARLIQALGCPPSNSS